MENNKEKVLNHLIEVYNMYSKIEDSYKNIKYDSTAEKDDFDYFERTKEIAIYKLPIMIEYLKTGNLPKYDFDPISRLGIRLRDQIILAVEDEIIAARASEEEDSFVK